MFTYSNIRILHIEQNSSDSVLTVSSLRKGDFQFEYKCVLNKHDFEKELIRIMKMSGYANVSQIYKNFYKESQNPEAIVSLIR